MNTTEHRANHVYRQACSRVLALLAMCGVLAACNSSLLPRAAPLPTLYVLDDASAATLRAAGERSKVPADAGNRYNNGELTLLVNAPRAAAGFDTSLMAYRRQKSGRESGGQSNAIEYFSESAWIDTPSRMLAPLMAQAIERRGRFEAVLRAPSAGVAQWRLETQLIRLQQEFASKGSQARVTLHAILIDTTSRIPVGWREFDITVPSASDNSEGGVAAANLAVARMLEELADFCVTTVKR